MKRNSIMYHGVSLVLARGKLYAKCRFRDSSPFLNSNYFFSGCHAFLAVRWTGEIRVQLKQIPFTIYLFREMTKFLVICSRNTVAGWVWMVCVFFAGEERIKSIWLESSEELNSFSRPTYTFRRGNKYFYDIQRLSQRNFLNYSPDYNSMRNVTEEIHSCC